MKAIAREASLKGSFTLEFPTICVRFLNINASFAKKKISSHLKYVVKNNNFPKIFFNRKRSFGQFLNLPGRIFLYLVEIEKKVKNKPVTNFQRR